MAGEAVRVSIYNVGFGDCFLLRFPGPDREHTLLIDCSSIKQGTAGSTDVIVKQIIEDITTNGVARIDVVAMTHRHKDHVSGFGNAAWRDVEVGDLEDPVSRALLERTTFYKIGHHGSHNATPVTFVEKVINTPGGPASEVWAAASVTEHGSFTEIPRGPLLTALTKRIGDENRVVRSDKPPSATSAPPGLSVVRANGKVIRLDFQVPV
jgi:hypothetical protein